MEPATHRRVERGPPGGGWSQRKLGQEEWKELRGGGVAGEPEEVGGGAPEPARGASKGGCTLEGRQRTESTARGGGVSWVAYHNRSLALWVFLVRSFNHSTNVIGRP